MDLIIPVVLAGGTGSRLWPLSRSSCPKQLLNILGDNTLLQETLLRSRQTSHLPPFIIYNKEYHYQIVDQARELGIDDATFLMEPTARNTAPAIALAAFEAQKQYGDAYLFVMPADHYLNFTDFDIANTLSTAKLLARDNYIVTFGVAPRCSESGYGYIQTGETLGDHRAFKIAEFIEKPSQEKADIYSRDGRFFWNSGMFFFRASSYLKELSIQAPDIYKHCFVCYSKSSQIDNVLHVDSSFEKCASISIDYAVMENTQSAAMIPLDTDWSDVGSWSSIFDLRTKNHEGNVIEGDVITEGSSNCFVHSSHRLVATVGLENHIVVETRDSVLVAHKDKAQDIKKIVEKLKMDQRVEATSHYQVFRPWGAYEILIDTPNYKVKRLTVEVGSSLSLQKHKHRSEHWVVVRGIATIINGEDHLILYPSQSTYIPQGAKHRLSNFSDQTLEIIEVQLGEYLGEDDIERFDDLYGRNQKILSTMGESSNH